MKTGKPGASLRHVRVAPAGHAIAAVSGPAGRVVVPDDRVGVFVVPDADHRGRVEWRLEIALDSADDGADAARVFGVEMVYVPAGAFSDGDPDPAAIGFNAVYRSDARGEPAGVFRVLSEGPVDVGPRDGALFYRTLLPQDEGDRLGPIPAAFPKGVAAFYTMKYEVTQGQYADFLNTLYSGATFFRAIHGGRGYASSRGTIRLDGSTYLAGVPSRPANWISWNDGLAFADWAGLRPMTELEFTKAARGTADPIAHEFPWARRRPSGCAASWARRRPRHGWRRRRSAAHGLDARRRRRVLLLGHGSAGSVWERVVTFGHRGAAPSAARTATGGSPIRRGHERGLAAWRRGGRRLRVPWRRLRTRHAAGPIQSVQPDRVPEVRIVGRGPALDRVRLPCGAYGGRILTAVSVRSAGSGLPGASAENHLWLPPSGGRLQRTPDFRPRSGFKPARSGWSRMPLRFETWSTSRSADIGVRRAARSAGSSDATPATIVRTMAASATVSRSAGRTPYSWLCTYRPSHHATMSPTTRPRAMSTPASRSSRRGDALAEARAPCGCRSRGCAG